MQNRVIDKKDKVVEIASATFFLPKIKKYIMINYGFDEDTGGLCVQQSSESGFCKSVLLKNKE